MATIRRANVILTVNDDQLERYLSTGFAQIDEVTGEIIKESTGVPQDLTTLKDAYVNHVREIAELKARLAKYEKVTSVQEDTTPEQEDVDEDEEGDVPKKKRTKKTN